MGIEITDGSFPGKKLYNIQRRFTAPVQCFEDCWSSRAYLRSKEDILCGIQQEAKEAKESTYSCDSGNDELSMIFGTGTWVKSPSIDLGVVIPKGNG